MKVRQGEGSKEGLGAGGVGKKRKRVWILIFSLYKFVNSSLSLFQGFIFMLFILISLFNARFYSHLISFSSILISVIKSKYCYSNLEMSLFQFKFQHVRNCVQKQSRNYLIL